MNAPYMDQLACKLEARSAKRRETLSEDIVAQALDELAAAIRELPSSDLIASHVRAHSDDCRPRLIDTAPRSDTPPRG